MGICVCACGVCSFFVPQGGKVISIELFVSLRASQFLRASSSCSEAQGGAGRQPLLPALELIYLFYGLIQMPDALLLRCLAQVDAVLEGPVGVGEAANAQLQLEDEERALAVLIKAAILKALRRWNMAKLLLQQLDAALHHGGSVGLAAMGGLPQLDLEPTSYVTAFARFELASLIMEQVQEKDTWIEQQQLEASEASPSASSAAAAAAPSSSSFSSSSSSVSSSSSSPSPVGRSPRQTPSLDQVMPVDAGPGTLFVAAAASSSSSAAAAAAPSPAGWSSYRLTLLDAAQSILKKAEAQKASYHFANRLHLRIHLACVEITMMRKHWEDIKGQQQTNAQCAEQSEKQHTRSCPSHSLVLVFAFVCVLLGNVQSESDLGSAPSKESADIDSDAE